ncbi:hypothetical protein D9M69_464220 [compost metagenome]
MVTEGLAAGDRVVLEGTDRLKEGSEVEVVSDSQEVPTTPTEHLQGKSAAVPAEPIAADKAKKGGA